MVLAVPAALLIAIVVALGLMRKTIPKVAIRNFVRRPVQSLLIVAGLLVSSLVIAAALVAGDSLRELFLLNAQQAWGPVDVELGQLNGASFPRPRAEELLSHPRIAPDVGARSYRLLIPASVEVLEKGTRETRVNVIGVDPSTEPEIGYLDDSQEFPSGHEAWLNRRMADRLSAEVGDRVRFLANPQGEVFTYEVSIAKIVPNDSTADWQRSANAFVSLQSLDEALGGIGPNRLLVRSNQPRQLIEAVTEITGEPQPGDQKVRVLASKVAEIDDAEETSEFFRGVLGSLGAVVALTSVALIVNLFVMLGEERRQGLGTMRALGLRRSGTVVLGLSEGVLYSIAAAIVGAGLGAVVGGFLAGAVGELFGEFSRSGREFAQIEGSVRPDTLLMAASGGFMVSALSVAFVSFRTSRMNVVSAIRDLPEPRVRSRRRRWTLIPVVSLAVGSGLLFTFPLGQLGGGTLVAIGIGGLVSHLNRRLGISLGGGLALGWGLFAIAFIDAGFEEDPNLAFTFFTAVGIIMVLGAVLVLTMNLGGLSRVTRHLGKAGRAIIGTAAAYAGLNRIRTGLSLGMFALVVYMIAGFSVWGGIGGGDLEQESGGFEIFARSTIPIDDLEVEGATVVPMFAGRHDFGYSVGDRTFSQPVVLYGVDESFVRSNAFAFSSPSGVDPTTVWQTLIDDPTTIVMDRVSAPVSDAVGQELTLTTDKGVAMLTIIGVADEGLFQAGFMSKETFEIFFSGRARNAAWLIDVQEGSPTAVVEELEGAHADAGLDAFSLEQVLEEEQSFQRTFVGLFQLLLKLGLVIGISGLAIGAARSTIERRSAVGILRAIGTKRWMVAAWLLVEHLLLATLGVAIGLGVGLIGAYLVVTKQVEGITFQVDTAQIWSTLLIIYLSVAVFTVVPALRTASLPSAEAVRYVE